MLQEQATGPIKLWARGRVVWSVAGQALHLDRSDLQTCPCYFLLITSGNLSQLLILSLSLSLGFPTRL